MTIVAFLQNQWVRDPVRVKAMIEKHGERYRQKFICFALFAGCLTGRRIRKAFGEEVVTSITWEETSKEIGDKASAFFPPDFDHINKVLIDTQPDIVIAFGSSATKALQKVWKGKLISGPHPAARGSHIKAELDRMALEFKSLSA